MSFTATIASPEKHLAWYKGVYVLSTIDETIKVTISDRNIILWNMHSTDTSMCQLTYDRSFFQEYEFKPYEMTFGENGLQIEKDSSGVEHKLYSFEINSKHLTTVSKRPDKDVVKKFIMSINNTATCPESLMNKFLINIEMESLIMKEYSPLFKPIVYRPIIVDLQYKRRFLDVFGSGQYENHTLLDASLINCFNAVEKELSKSLFNQIVDARRTNAGRGDRPLNSTDEINYMNCDLILMKNFVDNCNKNTYDDVKLELSSNKLVMTAFTKSIYKSNEILQNAINMSNTMSTLDLNNYCVFDRRVDDNNNSSTGSNKISSKLIVFKLKDFKNYITVSNAWKNLAHGDTSNLIKNSNNVNNISIWFCKPGEPILFEMSKNGIRAQLILVTDSTIDPMEEKRYIVAANNSSSNLNKDFGKNVVIKQQQQQLNAMENKPRAHSKTNSPLKLQLQDTTAANGRISARVSPLKNPVRLSTRSPYSNRTLNGSTSATTQANARKLFVEEESDQNDERSNNEDNDDLVTTSSLAIHSLKRKMSVTRLDRTETTVGWGQVTAVSEKTKRPHRTNVIPSIQEDVHGSDNTTQESTDEEQLGPTQEVQLKGLFD